MTKRMTLYLCAAGGALVLLIVGFFVILAVSRSSRLAPFRKNIDQYLQATNRPGTGGRSTFERGKVLPIDEKAKDVDSIYFELPADIVAQTPEDVGVIVRIKYATQPVGRRNQDFCLIDVYDFPGGNTLTGVVRLEDRKPSVRGSPEDPDRRSLNTKLIEFMSKLKPGVPVEDARPPK